MSNEGDKRRLVVEHLWLVRHVARRAVAGRRTSAAFEDAEAQGREALVRAAEMFDPSVQPSFVAFAWKWVEGAVRTAMRRERRHTPEVDARANEAIADFCDGTADNMLDDMSVNAGSFTDAAYGLLAAQLLAVQMGPEQALVAVQEWSRLRGTLAEARKDLPARDTEILRLRYDEGHKLVDVAEMLGMKYGTAKRYHHDALLRLGERLRKLVLGGAGLRAV